MNVPEDYHYYLSMHQDCNERLLARARESDVTGSGNLH